MALLPRHSRAIVVVALMLQVAACSGNNTASPPPAPVDQVQLPRYVGFWYEIARIPNRFQNHCVRNTTARYSLRDDGLIDVVNRCVDEDDHVDEAQGVARIVDHTSNAELEVSFFSILGWRPFWGDYWIIGLGPTYEYAVIGTPDRRYGWVLSRTRRLNGEQQMRVDRILRQNGYDPQRFESTVQRTGPK